MNDFNAPISLDLLGAVHGTDKSSSGHGYLKHYDRLLTPFRSLGINFVEIGIDRGASLATWRDYFEKATIVGIDIKEECRAFAGDRVTVEIGSQDDPGFLASIVRKYPPHIIIDDGSHKAHHIIFTFETLFPSLADGGIYIVEDLHFHSGPTLEISRGFSTVNPIDYFNGLSRALITAELDESQNWGSRGYLARHVDEIVFFGRALAIRKKSSADDKSLGFAAVSQYAENSNTAEAWVRCAKYLQANGNIERAEEALENALRLEPAAEIHLLLSEIRLSRGDHIAAMSSAESAIAAPANDMQRGSCLEHYGDLLRIANRLDDSLRQYRNAIPLISHSMVVDRIERKIAEVIALAQR